MRRNSNTGRRGAKIRGTAAAGPCGRSEPVGHEEQFSDGEAALSADETGQRARIEQLRERARQAGGGEMEDWTAEDCPLDLQEAFWESVLEWESAPDSSYLEMLGARNVSVADPRDLNSQNTHAALWRVIRGLADLNVYLTHTDHLSDEELYELLWREVLKQPTKHIPTADIWHCEIDLLGGCAREDLRLLRTYYPDDWFLGSWDEANLGPDPETQKPPFDRDRSLPRIAADNS